MKGTLAIVLAAALSATTAYAEKPAQAGKGKSANVTKQQSLSINEEKGKAKSKAKGNGSKGDNKGLTKQRTKKAGQVQKELGRGAEQGQQARSNRKKWQKFEQQGQ